MTRGIAMAMRLTELWVVAYTRGLDAGARLERQDEIASDLWEQAHDQPSRATAMAIMARCLLGMPADLSWRVEQARVGESLTRTVAAVLGAAETVARWVNRRGLPGLTVVVAVLAIVLGIALVITAPTNENQTTGNAVAGGILFITAGSFIFAGHQVRLDQPRAGAAMVSLGVAPVGLVFWATVVVPFVAVAVAGAACRDAMRQRRELRTNQ